MAKRKRVKSPFTERVFIHLSPENRKHADSVGAWEYGSISAFINYLISKSRGVKADDGAWKPKILTEA